MKRFTPLLITVGLLVASCFIYVGATHFAKKYFNAKDHTEAAPAAMQCTHTGTAHTITITDGVMKPTKVSAIACDTLTIINTDNIRRELAFGKHDHHQAYDGVTEKELTKGQSLTVTLSEVGTYTFHDHLHDALIGSVTVAK